jgi:hypothetical protein
MKAFPRLLTGMKSQDRRSTGLRQERMESAIPDISVSWKARHFVNNGNRSGHSQIGLMNALIKTLLRTCPKRKLSLDRGPTSRRLSWAGTRRIICGDSRARPPLYFGNSWAVNGSAGAFDSPISIDFQQPREGEEGRVADPPSGVHREIQPAERLGACPGAPSHRQ